MPKITLDVTGQNDAFSSRLRNKRHYFMFSF